MSRSGEETVDPEGCTAVLLSVPQQVAERIGSFLTANGIACRLRLNTEIPASTMDASAILPVWDVLVRPEDLPGSADRAAQKAPELHVPVPGRASPVEPSEAGGEHADATAAVRSPTVLCELPWDQAWALAQRLNEAGLPAAVMAPEEPNRDRPMSERIVPVGVRPEDLARAQAFVT